MGRPPPEGVDVVYPLMIHALVANTAFDGDEIKINAFRLYFALAQRLEVVILVAGNGQFKFGYGFSFASGRSILTKQQGFNNRE
jgi:hypothetical protein